MQIFIKKDGEVVTLKNFRNYKKLPAYFSTLLSYCEGKEYLFCCDDENNNLWIAGRNVPVIIFNTSTTLVVSNWSYVFFYIITQHGYVKLLDVSAAMLLSNNRLN